MSISEVAEELLEVLLVGVRVAIQAQEVNRGATVFCR
jgi:hypothetical protein